jgi:hypothetical protein
MRAYTFFCYLVIFVLFSGMNARAGIEEGLVIYFSFDEIDGNLVVNGANEEINGTLEGEAKQVAGYQDMGVALNPDADEGTPGDDFIRVLNDPEVNVGEQFTIAVWAKGSNFAAYRTLMSNTDASGYALTVENSKPASWVHIQGEYLQAVGNTDLQKDTWYHLALTFDGSDAIVYLDGEEEAKATKEGGVTLSTSDFFIGAEPSGTGIDHSYPAWHGVLDDFYFYNRALTKDEIGLLIKKASAIEPGDKLVINWGEIKKHRK